MREIRTSGSEEGSAGVTWQIYSNLVIHQDSKAFMGFQKALFL